MADSYKGKALGLLECDDLIACFMAADEATKAADVVIQDIERTRFAAHAIVKLRGSISDVKAAMEVAERVAAEYGKVLHTAVISGPSEGTEIALTNIIGM